MLGTSTLVDLNLRSLLNRLNPEAREVKERLQGLYLTPGRVYLAGAYQYLLQFLVEPADQNGGGQVLAPMNQVNLQYLHLQVQYLDFS